jgi:hypothetical protein
MQQITHLSSVTMNETSTVTHKTPLARWLFEHDVTYRDGAELFGTNRTSLAHYATGEKTVPPGPVRDVIARALTDNLTPEDLRRQKHDTV